MIAATVSAITTVGCQTLVADVDSQLLPLDRALTARPADIESAARDGDVTAQVALAVLHGWGIRGYRVDPRAAEEWRERALAARHTMPITQYTAAFNGQPSRVNIINVQVPTVSAAELQRVDGCLQWLAGRSTGDANACGSPDQTARRRALWIAASQ